MNESKLYAFFLSCWQNADSLLRCSILVISVHYGWKELKEAENGGIRGHETVRTNGSR